MSRRYCSESIEVVMDADGVPAGFRWRGRCYIVRTIVTSWVEAVPWWTGASGQRHVWRVEAARRSGSTGVYDLYRVPRGRCWHWVLGRVID